MRLIPKEWSGIGSNRLDPGIVGSLGLNKKAAVYKIINRCFFIYFTTLSFSTETDDPLVIFTKPEPDDSSMFLLK